MIPMCEVTIGVPVYRSVEYIEASLLSALNQTFQDVEFLIVDDAGNDGSMDVVASLQRNHPRGDKIRILVNSKNMGVSYSRNRIIEEAKGRYLYFMDSDDTIESNTIQLLYEAIIHNHTQIAYGSYEIIDTIGGMPTVKYQKDSLVLTGKDELAMYAFRNNHIFHVSVCNHLVSLEFLRQSNVRFIDTPFWEDMAYTIDLVTKVESAVMLSNITYHYLRHSGSLSHYQNRKTIDKEEIMKNVSVLDILKEKSKLYRGKDYLPYLCCILETNSFYVICYIIRNSRQIHPYFSVNEMRSILYSPFSWTEILSFKKKKIANVGFAFLGILPTFIFLPVLKLLGRIKKVL